MTFFEFREMIESSVSWWVPFMMPVAFILGVCFYTLVRILVEGRRRSKQSKVIDPTPPQVCECGDVMVSVGVIAIYDPIRDVTTGTKHLYRCACGNERTVFGVK